MSVFPLLAASFMMSFVMVVFIICAVILVLVILIQKGKGGGLTGALGGGAVSGVLGTKTGDFLTWFTMGLVAVFLTLAVVMAKFYKPSVSEYGQGSGQLAPSVVEQPAEREQPIVPVVPIETPGGAEVNSVGE